MCLHGYTGSPFEVRTTAEALARRGFRAVGPLLRGHGTDPALLNHVCWQDWLDDAVSAFDALPSDGSPRVVVGCSMGGLLALHLAVLRPVDVLVLLAPALRFHPAAAVGVAGLGTGLWRARAFLAKEAPGGDVAADDAQRLNPTYKVMPTRGLLELSRLQRATEQILSRVRAPVCLLHGRDDHTIAPSSSSVIARTVSSSTIEHHVLMRTWHLVALDRERDLANILAADFVDRVLPTSPVTITSTNTSSTNTSSTNTAAKAASKAASKAAASKRSSNTSAAADRSAA